MSDPSSAVQTAVYAALTGADIASDRVYDTPPANPIESMFPYVVIGEGQTLDDGNSCFDGSEVFVEIDVWSRTSSFVEAKTIAGQVRDVLAAPLILAGFGNSVGLFVSSNPLRDPDGITRRVRSMFRYLVDHAYP